MDFKFYELCRNDQDIEKIKELIDKGVNVNAYFEDYLYNCSLYISIYNNNYNLIKLLLDNGADVNISCSVEFTPLSIAILNIKDETDKYNIVDLLLNSGAAPGKTLKTIKKCRNVFWEKETKIINNFLKNYYSKL